MRYIKQRIYIPDGRTREGTPRIHEDTRVRVRDADQIKRESDCLLNDYY